VEKMKSQIATLSSGINRPRTSENFKDENWALGIVRTETPETHAGGGGKEQSIHASREPVAGSARLRYRRAVGLNWTGQPWELSRLAFRDNHDQLAISDNLGWTHTYRVADRCTGHGADAGL
jgi:hypothetical protein